jgi:hypothetical protein
LLLNKDEIHKKITPETIEELYPFETKIVDQEFIDEVIENEDSDFAYVQIVNIPGGKGNTNYQFVNCPSTGTIYCLDYPKIAVGIKGTHLITYNERIKGKNLRNFSKNIK